MPANMVVPPDKTTLAYKSLRMSTSHFIMLWNVVSWMPLALAYEAGLEEDFGAAEALAADGNDVAVWQLVSLLLVRALCSGLHLGVIIQCDVRQLLLDIAYNLALRGCGEGVSALCQDLHHVFCEISACQVQAQDCMGQRIAFVDGNSVRDTIARIHHNSGG